MLKGPVGLVAVLVVAGFAQAQEPPRQEPPRQVPPRQAPALPASPHQDTTGQHSQRRLSQADLNALTDARIGMAKAMLQMTPDQARLWPPIEEAIRNGAEARYRRIAAHRAMADQAGEQEPDPIARMRSRGEALSEEGDQLKKIADAWQPLYQTLTPEQKDRMRLVASHVLHETRGATGHRRKGDLPGAEEGEED